MYMSKTLQFTSSPFTIEFFEKKFEKFCFIHKKAVILKPTV